MNRPVEDVQPAIVARRVSHSYGSRTALEDVTFDVSSGALFGLLGPNGSGKSTLFRLLSTLIPVQSGTLTVCGRDVSRDQSQVRRSLSVTFQSPALDPRLTVSENLSCHGRLYAMSRAEVRDRTGELLSELRLSDRARDLVSTLSGGLKRRVELAKGLMHDPAVMLLDEPTSGLDPIARREFWDLIATRRASRRTTVVVATHLMTEAVQCDQLLMLSEGRVVAEGTPEELQRRVTGERLVLHVRDANQVETEISQLLQTTLQRSGNRLTARVTESGAIVRQLLDRPELHVERVEIQRASLDDVFHELTGQSLESRGEAHD